MRRFASDSRWFVHSVFRPKSIVILFGTFACRTSPTWRQSCVCIGRLSCDLQLSRRAPRAESISLLGKHDRVGGWAIVDSRSPNVTIKVCRPFILRALAWICRTWNRLCYINLRSAPYADVYAKWQRVVNALDSSNLNLFLLRHRLDE